jgi:16S rRNA (adenine1518-N6/adenine1519-N6)-dimethyltransferase
MHNPYLDTGRIRAALRTLELRPSRAMGQNFLADPAALQTIVDAAELAPSDTVVEVGPGLGVLTWELVRRAGAVIAVELDKRLAERLREEFASATNLTIVQSDVLRVAPVELLNAERGTRNAEQGPATTSASEADAAALQPPARAPKGTTFDDGAFSVQPSAFSVSKSLLPSYKVVANLPYAITSPALRHFLEARHKPTLMTVLVQREVAERIAAKPGDLSVLAHSVQLRAAPEVVAVVPPESFVPAPAVSSAVLRLRVHSAPPVDVDDPEALMRVIKAGFLHARKQLGNALPGGLAAMGMRTEKERVMAALAAAHVEPSRRAETVTLEEWAAVYRGLGGGSGAVL